MPSNNTAHIINHSQQRHVGTLTLKERPENEWVWSKSHQPSLQTPVKRWAHLITTVTHLHLLHLTLYYWHYTANKHWWCMMVKFGLISSVLWHKWLFLWKIVFISLLAKLSSRENNLTCLVRRTACLNVRKSPNAAVNRPLSMWTDDLGWLGGSGPPTLYRKPKKNLLQKKNHKSFHIRPLQNQLVSSNLVIKSFAQTKVLLSAECASMSEKGALPCLTSQTHSMPSCPPVATMCCWFGCLSTQCKGTLSPDLKRKQLITQMQNALLKERAEQKNKHLQMSFLG